jgi:sulfonate transport system permease protein
MKKHKFKLKLKSNNPHIQSLIPWVVPLLLIVIWQLLSSVGIIPSRVLPAPLDVVSAAYKLTLSGELFTNISISATRAITGFVIGGVLGLAWGCSMAFFLSPRSYWTLRFRCSVTFPI